MKPKRPRNTTPLVRPKAFELTVYGRRREDGSVRWFPGKSYEPVPDLVQSPNLVFHDCLRLERIESRYTVWRAMSDRRLWPVFPSSALEILRHPDFIKGMLCAHFIFEKHKYTYGLRLATEAEVWWWEHHVRATPTEGTTVT
jgi:hypothetical protein